MPNRFDETWHRLLEWTKGQTPSERLAAQILIHEDFKDLDPSHPLGGQDGGKDGSATKGGRRFAMGVYFPRGQQTFKSIKDKFENDVTGAKSSAVEGIAFVTNQELRLSEREEMRALAKPISAEIYHLERITAILDSPQMSAVRQQFLDIETDNSPPVHLGGQGGQAPGAGGGGGGAIGPNATGGLGGPGGQINLHGSDAKAPGAGGGGGGAIGEGADGGDGGSGGEIISVLLGPDEIGPGSGLHHMEIQVGKGGLGGQDGGLGGPGQDTIVNLFDEEGRVLRSIVAKGGEAGASPVAPHSSGIPTEDDLRNGLKVTCILAAEFVRVKNGLVTVLDGGWAYWTATTNPFRIALPLLVELETGTIAPEIVLGFKLVVNNPDGFQVLEQLHDVVVSDGLVRRSRFVAVLEFSGSVPGIWQVQILAGFILIGEFPIEIRMPMAIEPTEACA